MPQEITFLFTDIEGSTRLWEQEPERMRDALARHDELARAAVQRHRGTLVKMTGDGLHAAFEDALDALNATLEMQQQLADPAATNGLALPVRCGLHSGPNERRDGDFYGSVVNRAARIMSAAHGGQMLVSHAVAMAVAGRLPQEMRLREIGMVRLRDLASPERLYQLVHPALRDTFPALRSLEDAPNNLPHALTSFVGRERELRELRGRVLENRLVTLVGMGGIGKSRLSMHVAAELMEEFRDGVWLVELAPIADGRRVAHSIASVLGVQEEPGHGIEEALVRFLRTRTLLLVLDNCEHLVEHVAAVAKQLLSSAPGLTVLASSREPLHLTGESTYSLAALPVPGPLQLQGASSVASCDSVRLFVDRARLADASFDVTDDNAAAIGSICHRLDGIPLALELAAARVRSLPPMQIALRLDDRFRLLSTSDRTALPRQRTLRATIDWSYELLPAGERTLFRRFAVFSGGWTLEAAERLMADEPLDGAVIDGLGHLVEKSLVVTEDGARRYRMLETVRQYALQRLLEAGEMDRVRDRHLAGCVELAEEARPNLGGPRQGEWLLRLDHERDNLLGAHEWAGRSANGAQSGLRMLIAIKLYWFSRGLTDLGHQLMVEALARQGAQEPNRLRSEGLFIAGQFRYFAGRCQEARACLEESLAIARALGESKLVAAVLQPLGMAAIGHGDLPAARSWLEEAVALLTASGDKRALAGAVNGLAMLHRVEGRTALAEPLFARVVELAHQSDDPYAEAIGMLNLSMLQVEAGKLEEARRMLASALRLGQQIGSAPTQQSVFEVCAGLASAQQEWEPAARFFGVAQAMAARSGIPRDAADEAFLAPRVTRARHQLGDGRFDALCAEGAALANERALEEARSWLRSGVMLDADAD